MAVRKCDELRLKVASNVKKKLKHKWIGKYLKLK